MSFASRRITWILTAWFAALVGVDEGWHSVPGNGHWVELPGGCGVYVGYTGADRTGSVPCEENAFDDRERDPLPVRDAEGCAVCRLSGQLKFQRAPLDRPLSEAIERPVSRFVCPAFGIPVLRPFHARAPPQA